MSAPDHLPRTRGDKPRDIIDYEGTENLPRTRGDKPNTKSFPIPENQSTPHTRG